MEPSRFLPPLSRNLPTSYGESRDGMPMSRKITVTIPGVLSPGPRVLRQVSQIAINRSVPPLTPDCDNIFITNRTPRSSSPLHRRSNTVPASTNLSLSAQKSRSSRRQTARTNVVDLSGNVVLEQNEYLHLRGVRGFFPPVKLRCKSSPAFMESNNTSSMSPAAKMELTPSPADHDRVCPYCRESHTGSRCRCTAQNRTIPAADSSQSTTASRQHNEQRGAQEEAQVSTVVTRQLRKRDVPWVKAFKVKQKRHTKMNQLIYSPTTTQELYEKWRLAPTTDPSLDGDN
ncbi:uncharacterized protein LOC117120618 [Anneissia japonica]|uniref:uncharacterized protein LOC117120618 n=1 Tax=Anneissia japonica TaxID=1529436 RepID=UPI00142581B5|nr:uncharacterized protein LOC117120618 [Anneissia japonica]